ncbi:MAG TPA: M14 family metallopeptidase [Longimicrobiales bacterium]|nr:M14 family metallopeptidase [Longimicrobiales bacterium]
MRRSRRGFVACLALALAVLGSAHTAHAQQPWPRTTPERTDHVETTRYADVMAFLEDIAARTPLIQLDTFGYTMEGRALPLAIVGRLDRWTPDAIRASGRTVVYIQGNIHGGEVEGKESALMLLRDLAQGQHTQWLDSLVLLVAPIYNADGNERIRLDNRRFQHGPIGGMGQRPNAQGYDLNRDHMKLESPEARAVALLLQRYDPHVGIDLHTTNGTRHGYHLTYAPPLHPNTDSTIVGFLREQWLPAVTQRIREQHGWEYYYYGNLYDAGAGQGWYTFDHRARFNNNYLGLRNRFAILSEAYSYATFADRILATSRFLVEVLDFAHAHAGEVRRMVVAADAESVTGSTLALRAEFERAPEPLDLVMGGVVEERHPYTGEIMLRRTAERRIERVPEFGTFRPTETGRVPHAYLVPAELAGLVDLLHAHGVEMNQSTTARTARVERFAIDSTWVSDREFEQHHERTVTGHYESVEHTIPVGTWIVATDQPLGRLIFALLEPRSDDGVLNWNLLDEAMAGDWRVWPVLRMHEPW